MTRIRTDLASDTPTRSIGHLTALTSLYEKQLAEVTVYLQKRGFRLASVDVRKPVFQYAVKTKLSHPFNDKTKITVRNRFTAFSKRNNFSLQRLKDFLGHERLEHLNLLFRNCVQVPTVDF
jgi:hypothetical protein